MVSSQSELLPIDDLLRILPHRFPFLLVDRIVEIEHGVSITGVKNVSTTEPYVLENQGSGSTLPGLLILEALAQTGAVLLLVGREPARNQVVYFASVDAATWHGVVRAGDQLRLEITVTHARGRLRKVHGIARVAETVVCEADLAAVLVDRPEVASTP